MTNTESITVRARVSGGLKALVTASLLIVATVGATLFLKALVG